MVEAKPLKPQTPEEIQSKLHQLILLLIECRDALPAITLASAKLRNIKLDLADRIEEALKPWEAEEGEEGI